MKTNNSPSLIGQISSVHGSSLGVELNPNVRSGVVIIEGRAHRLGQVGSFVRIPQGYNDLYGIVSEASEAGEKSKDLSDKRMIKVELVGEAVGIDFQRGINQFPSINDDVHLVTETDLKKIYGFSGEDYVTIGRLSSSDSVKAGINLDSLVNKHSAILGSTGSGKSTGVVSLIRSIVGCDEGKVLRPSSRIIIFDLHGEYSAAFSDVANVYSVNPSGQEKNLYVPYWCISPDSLIDFLCGKNEQLKIKFIDCMVDLKRQYASENFPEIESIKVTPYSPIPFDLKKVWYKLYYDDSVTWSDADRTIPAIESDGSVDDLLPPRFSPPSPGNAPPNKGGAGAFKRNLEAMRSKLVDGQYAFFLDPGPWSIGGNGSTDRRLENLIFDWVGDDFPVTILDISGMPSSRLDLILGSMLDVLFEAAIWGRFLPYGMKEIPLLLVMEEAHRYLSNDMNGVAKDMVRRIAKEGRKFGVGLMMISQRPSEIDDTILSQCGTFFALRINNASDRSKIKSAMSDGLSGMIDFLPILRTGEAFITGEATKIPMRCRFSLPPEGRYPDSKDPSVSESWSGNYKESSFKGLVINWHNQDARFDPGNN